MDIEELKARRRGDKGRLRAEKLANEVLEVCCTGEYSANEIIAALNKVKDVLSEIPLQNKKH